MPLLQLLISPRNRKNDILKIIKGDNHSRGTSPESGQGDKSAEEEKKLMAEIKEMEEKEKELMKKHPEKEYLMLNLDEDDEDL